MNNLKYFTLCIAILLCYILTPVTVKAGNMISGYPECPEIFAETGVVVELDTGTVIYNKDMNRQMYPASITKILTTLLTIENCKLDEMVTFSHKAVYSLQYGDAHIGMQEGEQISVINLLHGVMLASANECANESGETVAKKTDAFKKKIDALNASGESYDEYDVAIEVFADMMNERAKKAGALNTHFMNPSGLFNENHYTTCYDMAMITRAAASNPTFLNIEKDLTYTIPPTNITAESRHFNNRHKMLYPENVNYYEGILGGKTGYVDQSGNTLVTFAKKDGITLISVVMKSNAENVYKDTRILLDYGFNNFKKINIAENEKQYTKCDTVLSIDKNAHIIVPNNVNYDDVTLEKKISPKGISLNYTYNGNPVGNTFIKLCTANKASFKLGPSVAHLNKNNITKENTTNFDNLFIFILITVTLILILVLIFFIIYKNKKYTRRRMR